MRGIWKESELDRRGTGRAGHYLMRRSLTLAAGNAEVIARLFYIKAGAMRGFRKALLSVILLMAAAPALPRIDQRPLPGPSPSDQLFGYYRRYPERYLRISEQSWKYDPRRRSAAHSFTLSNVATVPYYYIQVRFTYQDSSGKTLQSKVVQVLEGIAALGKKRIRAGVKGVPKEAEQVVVSIESARIILY